MKNPLPVITLVFFACAFITKAQDPGQTPTGPIFYTGQLDGFLGSWTQCQPTMDCTLKIAGQPDWQFDKSKAPKAILVGLGDNLAPDPESFAPGNYPDRIHPDPMKLNVVKFLRANYDAVVPGKQDFIFGANFLWVSGLWVKMVANNLVVQEIPSTTCATSPQLTPTAPLLPDQVSLAAAPAGTSGGGSGGGKGGKGGKGGGGGGGTPATPSSGGGGAPGGATPGCTPGVIDPERHALKGKDAESHPKPNMRWPSKDDVYPWTSQFTIDAIEDSDHTPVQISSFWLCPPESKEVPMDADRLLNTAVCTPLTADTHQAGNGAQRLLQSSDPTIPTFFTVVDESGKIAHSPATTEPRYRLYPATQGRLCYTFDSSKTASGTDHQCTDNFTVQAPLFGYAWRAPDDSDYVIFGALAPDTLNGVADSDKSWISEPHRGVKPDDPQTGSMPQVLTKFDVTHQVQVNDPTSAILQALHTYNLLHTRPVSSKKWGVVLAQMTPSEARSLSGDFASSAAFGHKGDTKIEVVLSAADPYEASLDTVLTPHPPSPDHGTKPEFVPVFTPAPLFDRYDCLKEAKASAESTSGCMASIEFLKDTIHDSPAAQLPLVLPKPVNAWSTPYCGDNDSSRHVLGKGNPVTIDPNQISDWECRLLSEMREETSSSPRAIRNATDIAILEEKDFDLIRSQLIDPTTGKFTHAANEDSIDPARELIDPTTYKSTDPATCDLIDQKTGYLNDRKSPYLIDPMTGGFAYPDTARLIDPAQHPKDAVTTEALWKAGRLARVSLLGSTLQTLLQQNDTLEKKTFQSQRDTILSQQLKIVGIFKDKNGDYYINGMKLMASQVYSVATNDQLANSTSDYSQLASKDLDAPDLYPIRSSIGPIYNDTCEIAYIGSQALQANPKSCLKSSPTELLTETALETFYPYPFTPSAQAESVQPAFTYSNRTSNVAPQSPTENLAQTRPYFRATMQQLAGSYALNKPNQTSASIGNNLAGVTNPNVASPYSRNWSVLQGARVEWYEPHARNGFPWFQDWGVDTQVNLAQSIQGSLTPSSKATATTTGQTIPTNSISITGNTLGFSPFLEFQPANHPDWKPLVTRFLYSRNLWSQQSYLTGCATTSPTCNYMTATPPPTSYEFFLSQTQSSFYGGSAGARYERNDFQYVELGYIEQKQTNVLSALMFNPGPNYPTPSTTPKCLSDPSGTADTCQLTGNETPTAFAMGIYPALGSSITPTYRAFHQEGAYVNLFYNYFIKYSKLPLLIQESIYGNYFAFSNRNESILTHYAFNSTGSVLLQLPANFSVGPTYGAFIYQSNAARGTQRSLTRITAGAQFNYSFDWHTGVSTYAFVGNTP
jgi:hypothetical protein